MNATGIYPDSLLKLLDTVGTPALPTDLGRTLLGSFGVDAISIHEVDERRRSVVTVVQVCADEKLAPVLRRRLESRTLTEFESRLSLGEPWISGPRGDQSRSMVVGDYAPTSSLNACLAREGSMSVLLSLTHLSGDRAMSQSDRKRFGDALPFVRSLWRAHTRSMGFESERNAIFEAVSYRGVGAITLDAATTAISVNRCAAELMTATGALRLSHAGLYSTDPIQMTALRAAFDGILAELRRGMRASSRAIVFSNAETNRSLNVHLCPIPVGLPRSGMRSPVIVALLSDPQTDIRPHVRETAASFGLTVVETELVCHLVQGTSLEEIATELRVSSHTVRKYLQQVFAKTGTGRQADLILLLISGAPPERSAHERAVNGRLTGRMSRFPARARAMVNTVTVRGEDPS